MFSPHKKIGTATTATEQTEIAIRFLWGFFTYDVTLFLSIWMICRFQLCNIFKSLIRRDLWTALNRIQHECVFTRCSNVNKFSKINFCRNENETENEWKKRKMIQHGNFNLARQRKSSTAARITLLQDPIFMKIEFYIHIFHFGTIKCLYYSLLVHNFVIH